MVSFYSLIILSDLFYGLYIVFAYLLSKRLLCNIGVQECLMENMAVYKKADLKTLEVALEVSITKLTISIIDINHLHTISIWIM